MSVATNSWGPVVIVLLSFSFTAATGNSASAITCASAPISAIGTPSNLLFLAKSRAKAAWRGKVTAAPGLGPVWIAWGIAQGRKYECKMLQPGGGAFGRKACVASATPCRLN